MFEGLKSYLGCFELFLSFLFCSDCLFFRCCTFFIPFIGGIYIQFKFEEMRLKLTDLFFQLFFTGVFSEDVVT